MGAMKERKKCVFHFFFFHFDFAIFSRSSQISFREKNQPTNDANHGVQKTYRYIERTCSIVSERRTYRQAGGGANDRGRTLVCIDVRVSSKGMAESRIYQPIISLANLYCTLVDFFFLRQQHFDCFDLLSLAFDFPPFFVTSSALPPFLASSFWAFLFDLDFLFLATNGMGILEDELRWTEGCLVKSMSVEGVSLHISEKSHQTSPHIVYQLKTKSLNLRDPGWTFLPT